MAQRTQGQVAIFRDHPNAETRASLAEIRPVGSARNDGGRVIADIYCARAGSEQEANAEFIVKAWNSHDELVAALQSEHQAVDWLMARLVQLDPAFMPSESPIWSAVTAGKEALDAAGAA